MLGPVTTDVGDSIVGAVCAEIANQPQGTFKADPAFNLYAATGVVAAVGGGSSNGEPATTWLSLQFPMPQELGTDPVHGAYRALKYIDYYILTQAPAVTLPVGTTSQAVFPSEYDSLCFADDQGATSSDDLSDFDSVTFTLTASDDTMVEGTIVGITSDGTSHRLDFHAPRGNGYYGSVLGELCCVGSDTIGNRLQEGTAAVCAQEPPTPTGTFTAAPSFGLASATGMNAVLQTDSQFLDLRFHRPATTSTDQYGSQTEDIFTDARLFLQGTTVPSGAASFQVNDEDQLCYADGLMSYGDVGAMTRTWSGNLTITAQTATRITGFFEMGTDRLDFDAPLQTTADFVPDSRCCPR